MLASLVMSLVKISLIAVKFRLWNSTCAIGTPMLVNGKGELIVQDMNFQLELQVSWWKRKNFVQTFSAHLSCVGKIRKPEKPSQSDIVFPADTKETFSFSASLFVYENWYFRSPFSKNEKTFFVSVVFNFRAIVATASFEWSLRARSRNHFSR